MHAGRARTPRSRAWLRSLIYTMFALICLGDAVWTMPRLADGAAYLAGAGGSDYFLAQANAQWCGKSKCHPYTTGVLEHRGIAVSWPGKVAPGSTFRVRVPVWPAGEGRTIISDTGDAFTAIGWPLLMYAMAIGFLVVVVRQIRGRRAIRRMGRAFGGGERG